jgi:hypothetical protein
MLESHLGSRGSRESTKRHHPWPGAGELDAKMSVPGRKRKQKSASSSLSTHSFRRRLYQHPPECAENGTHLPPQLTFLFLPI